jgi:hypothetical protein
VDPKLDIYVFIKIHKDHLISNIPKYHWELHYENHILVKEHFSYASLECFNRSCLPPDRQDHLLTGYCLIWKYIIRPMEFVDLH